MRGGTHWEQGGRQVRGGGGGHTLGTGWPTGEGGAHTGNRVADR